MSVLYSASEYFLLRQSNTQMGSVNREVRGYKMTVERMSIITGCP
jgi:hypothetical protein